MEYIFTLKYHLPDHESDPDALLDRLYTADCDDALAGVGQPGRLALEFSRTAGTAEAAVYTALADVKRAVPTARLIEASPDLVGLTDVAGLVGVSRQAMRKLMLTHRATFPIPVHEGSASIWHLAEVLDWLKTRGGYHVEAGILETARVTLEVNITKETSRHPVRGQKTKELLTT